MTESSSSGDRESIQNPTQRPPEPERSYPLAEFKGARPPAPAWFEDATAAPHADAALQVDGAKVVWRRWGDAGKPGLIFVHGGMAHLGWWDFIAPSFVDDFSPVALSLTGMGGSDRRETYSVDGYADEVAAVAEAAGLFEGGAKPIVVGHSFGGFVTLRAAALHGAKLAGAVICDTPAPRRPKPDEHRDAPSRVGGRVYADDVAALARFRLAPSQECENLYLMDHVARTALVDATDDEGRPGRTWAHDPEIWIKLRRAPPEPVKCPLAFIRGGESRLVDDDRWAEMQALVTEFGGAGTPFLTIPGARHHLMLDQPVAFIDTLKDLFARWP